MLPSSSQRHKGCDLVYWQNGQMDRIENVFFLEVFWIDLIQVNININAPSLYNYLVVFQNIHMAQQCDVSIMAQVSIRPKISYPSPVLLRLACPVKPRAPVFVGDS